MWEQPKRLYVAEFRNGVIKVGVTGAPGDRRGYSLRVHGVVQRIHYGQPHQCGFWAERQLIARVGRMACVFKGREFFTHIGFGAARNLVDQLTKQAHAKQAEAKVA
jgi:hypothetical protein